jgi:hypothetical protein
MLASCRQEKKTSLTTIDILDGLKTEKEFRLSEIVDDVEYVKLETTPDCIFSYASFQVGRKYILAVQSYNPTQIFLFDRTGKFIRKIGAEGKGPMEYTSLSCYAADPEEKYILVNDYQRDMLLKYNFEGLVTATLNYKENLGGDASDIVFKNSNEFYLRMDYPLLEKKNFYLIRKLDSGFHQLDSLYPVNSPQYTGNGYAWASGSFYLLAGAIQFRQFSFDTLFGESNGKMIPRFVFPIATDHLPGPYLVNGLHKQMMDYSNVSSMTELPGFLILSTRIAPNKGGVMIFDKSEENIFKLKKYSGCPPDTLMRRYFRNDIDGIVNPFYFNGENGISVQVHQVIDLKEQLKNKCTNDGPVKFPARRTEFINLINASKEDDNPILQIFHLK